MQQMPRALGLDFGTTNSVVALAGDGQSQLVDFVGARDGRGVPICALFLARRGSEGRSGA